MWSWKQPEWIRLLDAARLVRQADHGYGDCFGLGAVKCEIFMKYVYCEKSQNWVFCSMSFSFVGGDCCGKKDSE